MDSPFPSWNSKQFANETTRLLRRHEDNGFIQQRDPLNNNSETIDDALLQKAKMDSMEVSEISAAEVTL